MLEKLYRWFEPRATWAFVVILLLTFIFAVEGFKWRQQQLGENQTLESKCSFSQCGYTPATVADIFKKYKKEQLELYARTELTLDVVFPFIYSLLLILLMIQVFSAGKAQYLILLPLITGAADLGENFSVAYLALSFDGSESAIAWLAAVFTATKMVLLFLSAVALLVGAIVSFIKGKPF